MEPFDTFESTVMAIGQEVLIRAPGGTNLIGVVAAIDEELEMVRFADGRTYAFPKAEEVQP